MNFANDKPFKKDLKSKVPITVKVSPDIDNDEIDKISESLIENNVQQLLFQILD